MYLKVNHSKMKNKKNSKNIFKIKNFDFQIPQIIFHNRLKLQL